jgi:class 3 adenylate cyclase/tetratricopeptide (TPR) repeat protein
MTFDDILAQIIDLLKRQGRVSYGALKRRYNLDDAYLEDLKDEIIHAQHLAIDEDNRVLVWVGEHATASLPLPTPSPTTSVLPPLTEPERDPLTYTPRYLAEKILTSRSALEGERKQVTVLFADIKDSTELIRDLDPEDAQKLLDPAIHIMMNAVHRFEGTVNQVLGDGIMALFGAPIAHEDHAARACYAALAMQAAMQPFTEEVRRSHGITMRIRVGLNSGEVVVRTIGNDLHMDYSAVGPTTHLAARMEQMATPGTIRLTSATLKLVEGLVHVQALGPIPIRGMTNPVAVFELTGASTIRRRLQAAVARGLTKFVGRETEIAALHQALEQAEAGQGQVVAVVGEVGVGKSRLVYEFIHAHRTRNWLVLESASVSYGKATPYFPVVDLLKRYVHVEDGDDTRTIRAKVTGQIVTLDESLQETIPALLFLLDALPEDSPFLQLDPPQRRHRTLDGLQRLVLRESQVQPLLLIFENLHWIDSATQALLNNLIESLPMAQLLLLVNYRPEYEHSWDSKTYYTQLRLDPLPPTNADAFLEALLGNDRSLEPLKKLLIERTEGNPFFLEESVKALAETQVLAGAPGAYRLVQELPTIQVPATVQAVLSARIDRLPQEEKRLLQTAAVIGTEVPFTLIHAIAELSEEGLDRGLTHLQAAEFLYETNLFPERVYTFKHALTHEVAYSSLLQERRRVLHAHIVTTIEERYPEQLVEQVDRLAHHALRGEMWSKALAYYRQAGTKAAARSAYQEAVACFEQALGALHHLPETRAMREQAIELRLDLRRPLVRQGEFGRALHTLHEAATLAESLGDRVRLAYISSHMADYFRATGAYDRALAAGQRALDLAEALKDELLQAMTHERLGVVHHMLGDFRRATEMLGRSMSAYDSAPSGEPVGIAASGAVESRARLILCLADIGAFAEGIRIAEEMIRMAEGLNHPVSLARAYCGVGVLYLLKGDLLQAIPILERGLAVCDTWNVWDWHSGIASALGYAYTLYGRVTEALPLLEQAVERSRRLDAQTYLAAAYLHGARLGDASVVATQALERSRERRQRGTEALVLHLLGDLAIHQAPPEIDQAKTYYHQALSLANELGMRPLQAHCHRGLGTLYCQTGQVEQARAALSTAIDMYRDMEMTFWLPETEAALAEVEGR